MIRGAGPGPRLTAALLAIAMTTAAASAVEASPKCSAPPELTRLDHTLNRTARRLAAGEPLTIVAIGSSSTAGAGATSPAASYPSQLAAELQARFPGNKITVLNRGVNGEEARDMLARFDDSVVAARPDLVLWQLGTNSVLRDRPLAPASGVIREGLRRLKAIGADVVLIDPQFAPKVIAKHDSEGMVSLISLAAKEANIDLFPRYAVMRDWRDHQGLPFEAFLSPDGLHMNDWSYACLARLLGGGIAEAATRAIASAQTAAAGHPAVHAIAHDPVH
jgi:acyl-CoA thioesterase-1